ncbi:hypothetical protein [Haemophilus parainfluenzae]|uniref:hypothetical protein n=1 Tax=Haemophilus parainfluenzae TaxID=729 RepID=UPI000DADDB6F|nr:hypothetical protein [Haemophilus parainfluenzae]MBS7064508.1 hypothetical protein [Haemophilus parainfluenzae]RDE74776.1 hypothetical protein DPV81_09325 [Haemophilus parainfluenzae]
MNQSIIPRTTMILEQLSKIIEDVEKDDTGYFRNLYFKRDYFEHLARLVSQVELKAYNLKKEIILAQIRTGIPNAEIADAFKISPARVSQLKAEMKKEDAFRKFRDKMEQSIFTTNVR